MVGHFFFFFFPFHFLFSADTVVAPPRSVPVPRIKKTCRRFVDSSQSGSLRDVTEHPYTFSWPLKYALAISYDVLRNQHSHMLRKKRNKLTSKSPYWAS